MRLLLVFALGCHANPPPSAPCPLPDPPPKVAVPAHAATDDELAVIASYVEAADSWIAAKLSCK